MTPLPARLSFPPDRALLAIAAVARVAALLAVFVILMVALAPASNAVVPPCWPSQVAVADGGSALPMPGSGTPLRFAEDAVARAWGYWCPDPYGPAKLVLYSGPLAAWQPDWKQVALDLLSATPDARAAAADRYAPTVYPVVDGKLVVPAAVYPVHRAVWDRLQAERPPAAVWQVAANGTYPTRPAYPFAGGVRGNVSTARATVGAACDCRARSIEGRSVYCSVDGRADLVALCARQG